MKTSVSSTIKLPAAAPATNNSANETSHTTDDDKKLKGPSKPKRHRRRRRKANPALDAATVTPTATPDAIPARPPPMRSSYRLQKRVADNDDPGDIVELQGFGNLDISDPFLNPDQDTDGPQSVRTLSTRVDAGLVVKQEQGDSHSPDRLVEEPGPSVSEIPVFSPPVAPRLDRRAKLRLLPHPVPTRAYMQQAEKGLPAQSDANLRLLVVLDLNGVLIHRTGRRGNFYPRPGLARFLKYLFANHCVMVWSSARPWRVTHDCERLFTREQMGQIFWIWSRDSLRLAPHSHLDVQVYKQLQWVWNIVPLDDDMNIGPRWDQTNTVLIEDDAVKGAKQPFNVLLVDTYMGPAFTGEDDDRTLAHVEAYLKNLARMEDVSRYMRLYPFTHNEHQAVL